METTTGRRAVWARVSEAGERLLDLVYPPRCVSCNSLGAFICERCEAAMTRAPGPRCAVCWMPGPADPCPRCRHDRPAFQAARAAFVYEGAARDAVHALKFRGVSAVAKLMAQAMAECLAVWQPPVTVIVPVPLAGVRRRLRGYNQSELLARYISLLSGIPLSTKVLRKRSATPPQVQQPDELARRRNIGQAFAAGREKAAGGVLLVDDVITTGATLDACARVLVSAGAPAVYALTFARED